MVQETQKGKMEIETWEWGFYPRSTAVIDKLLPRSFALSWVQQPLGRDFSLFFVRFFLQTRIESVSSLFKYTQLQIIPPISIHSMHIYIYKKQNKQTK